MNRGIIPAGRIRLMAFALAPALLLAACLGGGEPSGKTEQEATVQPPPSSKAERVVKPDDGKIKIGFSMDTLLEDRWLKDRDLFRQAVESRGAEVVIMAANGNDALQIAQAETMINQGIDVLVVIPHDAEATAAIVEKAHSAGIKVISYDRLIRNADVDLYVSFDNEQVGVLQAQAITKLVPKGKYVYIGGAETDYNAHLVKKGVFSVLQPFIERGDITVVFDQWTLDWVPTNAKANMEAALKANQNEVHAVIAGNDATAGGAIQALGAQGLAGSVPVAGQDADIAAAQRIVQGTQTMTVYKPIRSLTEKAAELAVKLAKGEEVAAGSLLNNGKIEVPSVLLSPIAVDRHNIDQTIIADGFHSRDEVYQQSAK